MIHRRRVRRKTGLATYYIGIATEPSDPLRSPPRRIDFDAGLGISTWSRRPATCSRFRSAHLCHSRGDAGVRRLGRLVNSASIRDLDSGWNTPFDPHARARFDAHSLHAPRTCPAATGRLRRHSHRPLIARVDCGGGADRRTSDTQPRPLRASGSIGFTTGSGYSDADIADTPARSPGAGDRRSSDEPSRRTPDIRGPVSRRGRERPHNATGIPPPNRDGFRILAATGAAHESD